MNTYFYVQLLLEDKTLIANCGPYLDFMTAAIIAMQHADLLTVSKLGYMPDSYWIEVHECLIEEGRLLTVNVKTKEHRTPNVHTRNESKPSLSE